MPLDGQEHDLIASCRQKFPLPPDARYVLDGMLDDWQLDEGSYIALNLFVPRAPILALLDGEVEADLPRTTSLARGKLAPALLDLTDATLRELPQHAYDGLAQFSMSWLRRDIYGLAQIYAWWVHEDETEGGCLKPWRRGRDRRITRNGEVWPRTARRIRSPAFISRYVKRSTESLQRRVMANRLLDRAKRALSLSGADFDAFAAELAAQREAARVEAIRQFSLQHDREAVDADVRVTFKKQALLALRKRRRRDRGVIKRALNVASAVLSEAEISTFARGEFVRLPGQTMDLVVKLAGRIVGSGHGALAVYVTKPADTSVLAHLCTYVEDTPALDQLVAFSLAMKAGEEADIIRDANITQMLPEGRDHPLLAAREQSHRALDVTFEVDRPRRHQIVNGLVRWDPDEKRAREEAYWNETKHIWLERLAVFACGRRVKMLGEAHG